MRRYLDIRLALFGLLALLASLISAHGALVFFRYLADPWLAWVFTVVIALGIIGLDAAATLERQPAKRYGYLAGMLLFLGMEVLANYFAGQASFVTKVQGALSGTAPGADLLVITADYPIATRALVVLFLSLASIAVAAFVFAASLRVAQIRSGVTTALAEKLRRMLARRRRWYAGLARELRKVRKEAAQWVEDLEGERRTTARLRQKSARLLDILRSRRVLVRRLAREVRAARMEGATQSADYAVQVRTVQEQREKVSAQLRTAQEEGERLRQQLATKSADVTRLSADLETQSAVAALDVRTIAQQLRDDGVALRTIAAALNVSEKTIRNWTVDVRTNGHKEVTS